MRLSSLKANPFSDRDSQDRYWSLFDRISAATARSLDLKGVLKVAAGELGRALEAARCSVCLLNGDGNGVAAHYSAPPIALDSSEYFDALDAELAREVALGPQLVEIEDASSDARVCALFPQGRILPASKQRLKSILIVPLVVDLKSIGAIIIYRLKGKRWLKQEKRFVQTIASSLSLTIHQIQAQERATNAADREAIFNKLLRAIRTAIDTDGVLEVAVRGIGPALSVTRAVIYTHSIDGTGEQGSRFAHAGEQGSRGAGERKSTPAPGTAVGVPEPQSASRPPCSPASLLPMTARAEYRASVLVPSLLESGLAIESGSLGDKKEIFIKKEIFMRFCAGEIITVPDTEGAAQCGIRTGLGVRALVLAPIAYNGETVAALALEQFDRPRSWSEEEIKMVRLVTEQTAVALYQAELYREARDAARREALISKISSAIRGSLDSDTVLQTIVNELGAALSVCRCRLALVSDPEIESASIAQEYIAPCCRKRQLTLQTVPVRGNAHLQAVLRSEKPVATDDIMQQPRLIPTRERLSSGGVKSLLAVAIRLGGRPIGFFSLHHCEVYHSWTQWEIDVVQSVAEHAAVAIRQAQLYREARESATRAALVNQIVAAIRRSLDLRETLQVAVEEVGRALTASRTNFRKLIDGELVVVAEYLSDPSLSLKAAPALPGDYLMEQMINTRRSVVIDDTRAFSAAHPRLAATIRPWQVEPPSLSVLVCPIFINDRLWGAMSISQTDRVRRWTASEIALAEEATAQVEVAVSHSYLFEEARTTAEREALMGRIINGINQSNRLDEIFPIAARELSQHLAADRVLISDFDEKEDCWTIECDYDEGTPKGARQTWEAEDCSGLIQLLRAGPIRCNDSEADPPDQERDIYAAAPGQPEASSHQPSAGPNQPSAVSYPQSAIRRGLFGLNGARAYSIVPLARRGVPRLAITVVMKSRPRAWSDDEVEILRAAADHILQARERAELFEQVSRGKHEWEATFDALVDGIFIFDQDGILRRVNAAGAAFEGVQLHDLVGRRCCTLLQGIEGEECKVAKVVKTGRPLTFELIPEKLSRPVLVTISPLLNGQSKIEDPPGESQRRPSTSDPGPETETDHCIGAVCIVRDLSELRAAEALAREQRSFLARLVEHANDAISAFETSGRLVWFNEQLVRLLACSREELTGTDYRQFIASRDKEKAGERFARALAGQPQTFETRGIKKGGEGSPSTSRLLLVTYTPIYDQGHVTSVLSIARDITEERAAFERAAQADKLRALGQLASGVAHNFNNILAAILGHAQLIKRDSREERTLSRMDIIESAALDGAQTVKRIQGFGLGQDQTIYESVDINQLVQDAADLTRARWRDDARARGLHYEVEVSLSHVPIALGSGSELREVFVNIILNALDAMPQGGRLLVETRTASRDHPPDEVRACFTDNGIGMSREVRERIFEPFFTTKGTQGCGLGLAVSYSIIERHGGRLEVRSLPGQGSTFTVTLPATRKKSLPSAFQKAAGDLVAEGNPSTIVEIKILVIDDDQHVRSGLAGMLSSIGHHIEEAASGPEGLAKMETEAFDLVFTDLSMPGIGGWAVASEIRRRWPSVKVVLITGYALTSETIKHHQELADDVIFKPIRLDDIKTTLNQLFS
ncbi:MAG: GAF domain-containing protein [Blastocatellia bacterium]|nr:GAF domain-containing protein [Blastocatellia bacterium]